MQLHKYSKGCNTGDSNHKYAITVHDKYLSASVCELCDLTLFSMPTYTSKGKNKATTSKTCCYLNTLLSK